MLKMTTDYWLLLAAPKIICPQLETLNRCHLHLPRPGGKEEAALVCDLGGEARLGFRFVWARQPRAAGLLGLMDLLASACAEAEARFCKEFCTVEGFS